MSSPTDDELLLALKALHVDQPELGLGKIYGYLKENYKEWTVSSKRIKLLRDAHGMTLGQSKEVKPPGAPSKRFIKSAVAARSAELEASELSRSSGTQPTRNYETRPVAKSRVPEGLSEKLRQRVLASEVLRAQQRIFLEHFQNGNRKEDCWYPVLPEGVETYYDYNKVIWVHPSEPYEVDPSGYTMAERSKIESYLGNAAGIYMLFKSLNKAIKDTGVQVSEGHLAKQLQTEYGIDILTFERDLEANPNGQAGRQLMALFADLVK